MFRKDNIILSILQVNALSFQNSSVLFLSCEELRGSAPYAVLFLGEQLQVCLSFGGPMYFTKEKTHTCNQFIPIFLTVIRHYNFPTVPKLQTSVMQQEMVLPCQIK